MDGKNAHERIFLDQAGQAVAEARSLDEIKTIRDKAEAVRKYAQSASLGLDVQNRAAEVKLRAERQAGALLAQLMLRGGDRRSKVHRDRLKLGDLGLTANQSKRWQLQARVPEDLFRQYIKQVRETSKELTSAGLMRIAKQLKARATRDAGFSAKRVLRRGSVSRPGRLGRARPGKWDACSNESPAAELIGELKNHHT